MANLRQTERLRKRPPARAVRSQRDELARLVILSGLVLEHVRELIAQSTARTDAENAFRSAVKLLSRYGREHLVEFEGSMFRVELWSESYADYTRVKTDVEELEEADAERENLEAYRDFRDMWRGQS
jgi:hypothetical protein